ncbi:hypothetical protein PENTCL1PPCAC_27588, partial [Pristionchus entomophagus]
YSMPPKKRVASVSPKKAAKTDEMDTEVMDDIESEGIEGLPQGNAPSSLSSPAPPRKKRKEEETEEAVAVDDSEQQKEATDEAPPLPDDAADEAAPILDDGNEMEEIIVTRDEEDEDTSDAPVLLKEEPTVLATPTASPAAPKTPTTKGGGVAVSPIPKGSTTKSRVPRLRIDQEPSEDVKKAQTLEDNMETEVKPLTRKPAIVRRQTSPPRTRGFTSAATLSATMKESKERLKRVKKEKEEGLAGAAGEEEVDVENEGEAVRDGNSETANTCTFCSIKFPLQLEMIEHQLNAHKKEAKHQRERGGTLMCAHPHCGLSLKDMQHHLAHLAGYHNQTQFRIRQQHFNSEEAFMAWKLESEQRAKSNYIARNEELESEPGVTELELYCECSEEWRNADKDKNMSPLLACPAHFTVRLDRNKDKVMIIGCTSHLGHLKKPNWSVYEPNENTVARKSAGIATKQSKCHLCGEWFRSRTALTIHRRTAHPDNIRTATIACGDPNCDMVTDTMLSLCEHVADAHKREDLTVEEYRFNSIEDFEAWKERMEADTMSYYTKVSGRQRAAPTGPNSECFFRYYQCHLSGYNQRPSQKKHAEEMERVRLRNRGTKKMNRFCTAFMNIKINDNDGSVLLKGCLGHFGHECDIRRVPMPNSLRQEIIELLQKGITEDDVLACVKSKASIHDRAYYLQKYEVKNIVKKLIKESNGAMFYKYDDEGDMGMEDEMANWEEMKRPFASTMYRSMITHPKRRSLGTYALQFNTQMPRKRRLVIRGAGDHTMHDGGEYYEDVVEEMALDTDVTYLEEGEMDPTSSHLHMVQEGEEHQEEVEVEEHHEMHDEMANEASTSSSSHLVRRRKMQPSQQMHMQQQHHHQRPGAAARIPLLKDGSEYPPTDRDRQLEFTIHNIRTKIMELTDQLKRCKNREICAEMADQVRLLESRMARIIPQTGPGRMDQTHQQYVRRDTGEELEVDGEYYDEEMVDEEGGYVYEMDPNRPGTSTMVVPRGVPRTYGHHEVIYQDVGSPGVEVDVEDLDDMEEGEDMGQMDV